MDERIRGLLSGFELRPPASREAIRRTEEELATKLPDDYLAFMAAANGGEGPVGDAGYLVLWPIERLAEYNRDYCVEEFAPGLVLVGSDGGGTAYAIDTRVEPKEMVSVPFVPMDLDEVLTCGDGSLATLIRAAANPAGD